MAMMARALRPSHVALWVALLVLGTFWGSSVVFFRAVRAKAAGALGVRHAPALETCEQALTFWVSSTATGRKHSDAANLSAVGSADDQAAPHVSQCRRCCACDWHRTEEWLRLQPEIDARYEPVPPPTEVDDTGNTVDGYMTTSYGSQDVPQALRGPSYSSTRESSPLSHEQPYARALRRSKDRLDVSWRPALPEAMRWDSRLRDCGLCYGCSQILMPSAPYLIGFNHTFKALPHNRQGAEVYRAYGSSESAPSPAEVPTLVKLWPCSSSASGKRSACPKPHDREALYSAVMAVQILVEDIQQHSAMLASTPAGQTASDVRSLFPRTWVQDIQGVLLGSGERVSGDVVASEPSSGIPAARLMGHPWPWVAIEALQALSSSQLLTAAVMDVLLINCNRDLEDLLVSEDGRLHLVNNEQVFGHTVDGRRCITNSIFVPTSQNFKIATMGLEYVAGLKETPRSDPQLAQLLDYRCHLPEGLEGTALGTAYPPEVTELLTRLSHMGRGEIAEHYGLPDDSKRASLLRMRAQDMLIHGFEWVIDHADRAATVVSSNENYLFDASWPSPCCRMAYTDSGLSCLQ